MVRSMAKFLADGSTTKFRLEVSLAEMAPKAFGSLSVVVGSGLGSAW
jgi:hypothetical protein